MDKWFEFLSSKIPYHLVSKFMSNYSILGPVLATFLFFVFFFLNKWNEDEIAREHPHHVFNFKKQNIENKSIEYLVNKFMLYHLKIRTT